jgi:LPS-assembly protein
MNNILKGKAKYITASIVVALMIAVTVDATDKLHFEPLFYKTLTADTLPAPKKTKVKLPSPQRTVITDSVIKQLSKRDSNAADTNIISTHQKIDSFDLKMSKDSLNAPVYYRAEDSMVMDVPANKIMLYGKETNVKYQDNELTAPGITFDQKNNLMTASFLKDSTGKVIASPTFKQKDLITVSDYISFNPKTGKGLTKGNYTQQGEMYVYGERIKKIPQRFMLTGPGSPPAIWIRRILPL